jgi:predicted xylose isomerase-like sugar epimerase
MTKVHRKVATMVLGPARARTRRQSGDLAGSYRVRASAAKASIASALVYAPVQEFGWPRHSITPSHALVGALEDLTPAIADEYRREVTALVDRLNVTG